MTSPLTLKKPSFTHKILRRKTVLMLVFIAVIGVGGSRVIAILSAPAEGTETHSKHAQAVTKQKVVTALPQEATPDNQFFSLRLPTGYHVQENSVVATATTLYTLNLTKPGASGTLLVAISIKPFPAGGISGDASYALRVSQPDKYTFSKITVAGQAAQMSSDRESGATTAFFSQGSYLATVSLSSGLGNPGAQEQQQIIAALTSLLAAWQWRT
jgi:hypothetical protein